MTFYFLFLSILLNSYQNITSMSLTTLSNLRNLKTEVGLELQIWRGKSVQYRRRLDEEQLTLKLCQNASQNRYCILPEIIHSKN